MTAADFSSADINDRVIRMEFAVGFFIWLLNAFYFCNNVDGFEIFRINGRSITDQTNNAFLNTMNFLRLHVHRMDTAQQLIDLTALNISLQKNNHTVYSFTR